MNLKTTILSAIMIVSILPTINTNAYTQGDNNQDGSINVLDLVNLKQAVLNFNTNSSFDVDDDGITNSKDVLNLKQIVLGLKEPITKQDSSIPYILTSNLNFRDGAGTEYPSYGIVPKDTIVSVTETAISSDGVTWGKYTYNGNVGWSSLKYATPLQVVGTTSNGHTIYDANGLTYVDGVLIVNKTYSIPSDYAPANGTITTDTQNAFNVMKAEASKQGLNLYISSGYRSYTYQKGLYQRYVSRDGKALADTYSARAGHSEHQTGLCFDLNTISDSFAYTDEGKWVAKNCYKYGFIIRYPKTKEDITGYKYEPWHLRYVGVDLATTLYQNDLTLEEYFGITSSYAE